MDQTERLWTSRISVTATSHSAASSWNHQAKKKVLCLSVSSDGLSLANHIFLRSMVRILLKMLLCCSKHSKNSLEILMHSGAPHDYSFMGQLFALLEALAIFKYLLHLTPL